MRTKLLSYVMLALGLLCMTILGCRTLIDSLTPVIIPEQALQYVGRSNGWTSLRDARDIRTNILITHRDKQLELIRNVEDDKYAYEDALQLVEYNIREAEELQALVIGSSEQPFSILGILAGAFPGLAIGSLLLKRPQDYTKDQVEAIVAKRLAGAYNQVNSKPV